MILVLFLYNILFVFVSIGTLDQPLVLEGKRDRKSTDFLMNTFKAPQSGEKKKIDIPQVQLL